MSTGPPETAGVPRRAPEWVTSINALGENLGDAGRSLVSLDEAEVLGAAVCNTGLDDFGDDWFREPLRLLLRALEEEAELTLLGRLLARVEVQRTLQNRLRIEAVWREHPELADEEVKDPIFVCGLGRTGTTLLHEILAQDPAHRVPLLWEMLFSVPPPEAASYRDDPRIEAATREIRMQDLIDPAFTTMHVNAGDLPNECIFIVGLQFLADTFAAQYHIPSYSSAMAGRDLRPVYAYHKRVLQLLQWKHGRERWVLKAPTHLGRLDALFAVYPDARVVVTHRDPLCVISSLTSLLTTLKGMRSDRPVEADVAATSAGLQAQLEATMRLRDQLGERAAQVVDVRYRDLLDDPLGTLEALYARWGLPLGGEARERMRRYLAGTPQGRAGLHRHSLAGSGLDLARERARFAAYQARFGVPSEVEPLEA